MNNITFVEDHYQKITVNLDYRQKLINNPKQTLSEEYGCIIQDQVAIEIIEQDEDTIVIMLPEKPKTNIDMELSRVTEQVTDLLFADGIGGFIIPNDGLKWELRNMRKSWINKVKLNLFHL